MKNTVLVSILLFLLVGFYSCEEDTPVITQESMVGKWLIKDRSFGFTTDCERNEYIMFNADSTLIRQQCGQTTGSWYVANDELFVQLVLDTVYANGDYKCELLEKDVIKIKSVDNAFIWASYQKE